MGTLRLVGQDETAEPKARPRIWREQPVSDEWIFRGQDEAGRRGWFLRLNVTGLYPRRVGPFPSKAQALDVLEEVIAEISLGALLNLMNKMTERQACLVEGVPTLRNKRA